MASKKRKSIAERTLFVLILFSLCGIIYVAGRDLTLSPAELFETAQKAESAGSYKKAERYYMLANERDNQDTAKLAAYYLGRLYKKGGPSFPVNGKKAEMFLEQAALQNVPQAQYELALMYDIGDKIPENREKALKWMNLAAQNGLPEALYSLGVWVERGYLGEPNTDKVLTLYETAASKGHIFAMTSLIALYSGGFQGVSKNQERADYWFQELKKKQQILNAGTSGHQEKEKK